MVPVQVFDIGCMVYPVMGRSIEYQLYPPGQLINGLRMDPELVDETDGLHAHHHGRGEPQERHPDPEKESAGEIPGPVLPQRGGQVIFTGRVVHHMGGPEKTYGMARSV